MLVNIILAVLMLAIWVGFWMALTDSNYKSTIADLKIQLDNLIKTYNNDTNDLNNKLQDALWSKHNLRQEVVKLKNDLIEARRIITSLKNNKVITTYTSTKDVKVNTTNNDTHTPKRGRPRKIK